MPRQHPSLLRRQRISRTHRGIFCRLFLYRKGSAVKSACAPPSSSGGSAMRRPCPDLHPLVARHLGIHLMYAPPYRHVPHTPLRPLVVCGTPPFAGAKLYCSNLRMGLRRRFIMDIAQGLSVFPLVFLFALPVSQLIDDPRWYLISIIPQTCIVVGLTNSGFCRPLYINFANWWKRRLPHA